MQTSRLVQVVGLCLAGILLCSTLWPVGAWAGEAAATEPPAGQPSQVAQESRAGTANQEPATGPAAPGADTGPAAPAGQDPAAGGAAQPAKASVKAVVVIRSLSQVQGERVLLGDVAEITGAPELAERLKSVDLGMAPLPGRQRTLTQGWNVKVELRRAGIDLSQVEIRGPQQFTVFRPAAASQPGPAGASAPEGPAAQAGSPGGSSGAAGAIFRPGDAAQAGAAPGPGGAQAVQPLIRYGQNVLLIASVGSVRVEVPAVALGNASLGELVKVQNTRSNAVVLARVVAAGQVMAVASP